jgi:hypothetical protein
MPYTFTFVATKRYHSIQITFRIICECDCANCIPPLQGLWKNCGTIYTRDISPGWYIPRLQRLRATNSTISPNHNSKQFEFTRYTPRIDNIKNIFTIPHTTTRFQTVLTIWKRFQLFERWVRKAQWLVTRNEWLAKQILAYNKRVLKARRWYRISFWKRALFCPAYFWRLKKRLVGVAGGEAPCFTIA